MLAKALQASAPDKVCLLHAFADGAVYRRYTFSEIWSCADGFSRQVVDSTVAVMIPRSAEYIAAILAVNKAGSIFVPLDPSWPVPRIVAAAVDSGASAIVGCEQCSWLPDDYLDRFREVCRSLSSVRVLRIGFPDNGKSTEMEEAIATAKTLPFSYIMYTSGSTGKPKGVCGTDAGLLNRLQWMERTYPHSSSDVALFKTAISFIDHLTEALAPIFAGAMLIVPCESDIDRNPLGIFKYLQNFNVTRLVAVPSLLLALLPAFESSSPISISLRILVSSGESLPYKLVLDLRKCLPRTTILNLYGSTEVSGDCSCFDCSELTESHRETNIPIGNPIAGCEFHLQQVESDPNFGELIVSGTGVAHGYWNDELRTNQRFFETGSGKGFKTGDLARRLANGDIVLVGRTDRLLQVRGQRVEPEEIERVLEEHRCVDKAAVYALRRRSSDDLQLAACLIRNQDYDDDNHTSDDLREWLRERLPMYMIPERYRFVDTFPLTNSGKIDYSAIQKLDTIDSSSGEPSDEVVVSDPVRGIAQVFSKVLLISNISPSDDFFLSGGTSISAAHAAHQLGIDMRLLFKFRTAIELHSAMQRGAADDLVSDDIKSVEIRRGSAREEITCSCFLPKKRKIVHTPSRSRSRSNSQSRLHRVSIPSAFVRNQQRFFSRTSEQVTIKVDASGSCGIRVSWKKCLHACVDASPLLLITALGPRIYIGSHAWKFACIDATSGEGKWETTLLGRVESTAVVTSDFSQIVVGCYDGSLYFLDPDDGKIQWSFKTSGEVKCQPVVDDWEGFVWCGSHDHTIYVLDPVSRTCVWNNLCNGSIFGSPAIDSLRRNVYVATTSGRLYLIHTQPEYSVAWERDLESPIFASPTFDPSTGYVLVATVSGTVVAFSPSGDIRWKVNNLGPVFSGVYISSTIFHQAFVCSRDGYIYSYCQVSGKLLWKISLEEPIVSGPWIEETVQLLDQDENYRFLCASTTSGNLHLLKIPVRVPCDHSVQGTVSQTRSTAVIAKFQLPGDVFSTPLMLGGQIFVGCRDNNLYSLAAIK